MLHKYVPPLNKVRSYVYGYLFFFYQREVRNLEVELNWIELKLNYGLHNMYKFR